VADELDVLDGDAAGDAEEYLLSVQLLALGAGGSAS